MSSRTVLVTLLLAGLACEEQLAVTCGTDMRRYDDGAAVHEVWPTSEN